MPEDGNTTDSQDSQQPGAGGTPAGGGTPQTWDQVVEALPEGQRALYEQHTQGLRSALQSEREQRQDLAKQLREATQQLEEGSQARQQLEQLTGQAEAASRRAAFFEEAARTETGCSNPRLAWLAAQELDAFDRRGNVDWEALRKQFPELFGKQTQTPPGNAGSDYPRFPFLPK